MQRAFGVAIIGLWIAMAGGISLAAEEKTAEELEAESQREKNPRKRAELARELMDRRLEQLRSAVHSGTLVEETGPLLDGYLTAVEWLGAAVLEASHTGTSKSTEVHLRRHLRELENLKLNVSFLERAPLEKVIARVVEVREEVLYSIMHPRKD